MSGIEREDLPTRFIVAKKKAAGIFAGGPNRLLSPIHFLRTGLNLYP